MEPGYVTAAEFGDKWPIANADSAIVFCEAPKEVYIKINGKTYPLNGTAIKDSKPDWSWRKKIPLEGFPGEFSLADVTPLIERGLQLCSE